MKSKPIVTVALPVYNGGAYLDDAIRSILNQTYQNWELLIIDDGSTDGSLATINKYNDPRITVIHDGENMGLSARLNQSILLATGELYARMDADDVMVVTRLEEQVNFLLDHSTCDVVGSSAYVIDGQDHITGIRGGGKFENSGFENVIHRGGFMHPTVMGRTSWFRAHQYNTQVQRCEDIELWLRTADISKFCNIDKPLLFYREVGDQSVKVEKTIYGFRDMLYDLEKNAKPEYRPLIRKKRTYLLIRIWIRRLLNLLGLEKAIVSLRSQRLVANQKQVGEELLKQSRRAWESSK